MKLCCYSIDDLRMFKKVQSFLENYSFGVRMKLIVNYLPFYGSKCFSIKVISSSSLNPFNIDPLLCSILNQPSQSLQILLSRVILLVKNPNMFSFSPLPKIF